MIVMKIHDFYFIDLKYMRDCIKSTVSRNRAAREGRRPERAIGALSPPHKHMHNTGQG